MKTVKRQLSVLFAVILLLSCLPLGGLRQRTESSILPNVLAADAIDFGTCGENLMWYLDVDGLLTVYGTGEMEKHSDLHRPKWMQYADSVKSLKVEEGVTSITALAFDGCTALASISVPESLEQIHGTAFEGTAFYNDENNYEDGVLYLGKHLLRSKPDLAGDYTVKDGTRSIADNAFFGCDALTSVSVPQTVKRIGTNAFYGCSALTQIDLPDSGMYISAYAFSDSALYADERNWENGALYLGKHLVKVNTDLAGTFAVKDGTKSVACNAFEQCSAIEQITLPDSVSEIGANAFDNCRALTLVTLPAGLTRLNDYVFVNCRQLQTLTLPQTLTHIGEGAFAYCCALQTITVPAEVTDIGVGAFSYCTALTAIDVNGENTAFTAADGILYNKNGTSLLAYPQGNAAQTLVVSQTVEHIADFAFAGCTALQNVTLPDGLHSIGAYAFDGCASLSEITFEQGMLKIGERAFQNCTALTAVALPERLTEVSENTFTGCASLRQITFGKALTAIGNGAFSGCSALQSTVIPDGVAEIGMSAFRACDSLTSVTLPDSIESIGLYAFSNCAKLTDIYFLGSRTEWTRISSAVRELAPPTTVVHCNYKGEVTFSNSQTVFVNSDSILVALYASDVQTVLQQAGEGATLCDSMGEEKEPTSTVTTGDILITADGMEIPVSVPGDIEGDNQITPSDARLVLRCAVGLDAFDDVRTVAADIDGDFKVGVADARRVLRASVELEQPEDWFVM